MIQKIRVMRLERSVDINAAHFQHQHVTEDRVEAFTPVEAGQSILRAALQRHVIAFSQGAVDQSAYQRFVVDDQNTAPWRLEPSCVV